MDKNIKERLYETGLLILVLLCLVIFFNRCDYKGDSVMYQMGSSDTIYKVYRDSFYIEGKGKVVYKKGDTVVVVKEGKDSIVYRIPFMTFKLDTLSPKKDTIKLQTDIPSGRFSMTFNGVKDSVPQVTTTIIKEKKPTWFEEITPYLEGLGLGFILSLLVK